MKLHTRIAIIALNTSLANNEVNELLRAAHAIRLLEIAVEADGQQDKRQAVWAERAEELLGD